MDIPYVTQLCGGKYIVSRNNDSSRLHETDLFQSERFDGNTFFITEQPACPIGFSVNSYITEDELRNVPAEKRALVLMNSLCVTENISNCVAEKIPHVFPEQIDFENPEKLIAQTVFNKVSSFTREKNGFSCNTKWEEGRYVYFTVPYDKGWRATIDGDTATIINSGGMMAVYIQEGSHMITFAYSTPGFREGICISAISLFVFVLFLCFSYRKRMRSA